MLRVRRLDSLVLICRRLDGVGVADRGVAVRRVVTRVAALVPLVPVARVGPPSLPPDQPRADCHCYHDDGDHDTGSYGSGPGRVGGGFGLRGLR